MKLSGYISPTERQTSGLKYAVTIILFFLIMSLVAPWLANEKPIYVNDGDHVSWPLLSGYNWQSDGESKNYTIYRTLIPFSPETIDIDAILKPPGFKSQLIDQKRHWLGTDHLGRDVFAGIIHGSRTALWVSLGAVVLAFIGGLFFGLFAGYYDQYTVHWSGIGVVFWVVAILILGLSYLFLRNLAGANLLSGSLSALLFLLLASCFYLLWRFGLIRIFPLKMKSVINFDTMGMRLVDLVKSLPPLFIVLLALQLVESANSWNLIWLIALLIWPGFARHSRAETIRTKGANSVKSALLQGRSDFYIWRHDIIPQIVRPLIIKVAFAISGAILLEATLSFLGLGLPVEHTSWGTLISSARLYTSAWWLLLVPGLCIILLLWSLQYLGRHFEWRLKQEKSLRILSST